MSQQYYFPKFGLVTVHHVPKRDAYDVVVEEAQKLGLTHVSIRCYPDKLRETLDFWSASFYYQDTSLNAKFKIQTLDGIVEAEIEHGCCEDLDQQQFSWNPQHDVEYAIAGVVKYMLQLQPLKTL